VTLPAATLYVLIALAPSPRQQSIFSGSFVACIATEKQHDPNERKKLHLFHRFPFLRSFDIVEGLEAWLKEDTHHPHVLKIAMYGIIQYLRACTGMESYI
jgi:hypothetical protein